MFGIEREEREKENPAATRHRGVTPDNHDRGQARHQNYKVWPFVELKEQVGRSMSVAGKV